MGLRFDTIVDEAALEWRSRNARHTPMTAQ